jgi:hypothetical protein
MQFSLIESLRTQRKSTAGKTSSCRSTHTHSLVTLRLAVRSSTPLPQVTHCRNVLLRQQCWEFPQTLAILTLNTRTTAQKTSGYRFRATQSRTFAGIFKAVIANSLSACSSSILTRKPNRLGSSPSFNQHSAEPAHKRSVKHEQTTRQTLRKKA